MAKTLPHYPYLQNIVAEYHRQTGTLEFDGDVYIEWLKQFGFKVPSGFHELEFPDDFPDKDLAMFILRWS